MARMTLRRLNAIGLGLAVVLACAGGDEAPKVSLAQARADSVHRAAGVVTGAMSADAQAALDSGNALFRSKAYGQALAQYRRAAAAAPSHAAPLFGVFMVARATGNGALADSALAGIRERGAAAPSGPLQLGDSTLDKIHGGVKKGPVS